jgi:hypothetical protein
MKRSSTIIVFFLLLICSCVPQHKADQSFASTKLDKDALSVSSQEVDLIYVAQTKELPAHIVINKSVRYRLTENRASQAFNKELMINALMHNVSMEALVQKNGKTLRKYSAQKTAHSLNNDKSFWTLGRPKLLITIPFLNAEEEVVIKSSYSWMDPRWHWPIFMEEAENTQFSKVTIDIPYGIGLRFKATKNGEPCELEPKNLIHENSRWVSHYNRQGQGTRFIFEQNFGPHNNVKKPALRQQLFLAFDSPAQLDKKILFDSWQSVASFLYNKIDRYDLPSNAIKTFSIAQTNNKNDTEKIARILSFLNNDIEKRSTLESFLEQEPQPATRTFTRRFGSPLDIAILGKAMLSSIGISSDIIAVADPDQNPHLNFFSPSLFHNVILAIYDSSKTFYYDPAAKLSRFDLIPPRLQGQDALAIKDADSSYFSLPIEAADKNQSNYFYELSLSNLGNLEGTFALNLLGIKADEAKNLLNTSPSLKATALQQQLQQGSPTLSWNKASLHDNDDEEGLSFSGVFSPYFLTRNENNNFILALKDIFEPIFSTLKNNSQQYFSSLSTLEAIIYLPTNFKVTNDKPLNFFIDHQGLRARFVVSFEEQKIVFKGESTLTLPRKNISTELSLPEGQIHILDTTLAPEKS